MSELTPDDLKRLLGDFVNRHDSPSSSRESAKSERLHKMLEMFETASICNEADLLAREVMASDRVMGAIIQSSLVYESSIERVDLDAVADAIGNLSVKTVLAIRESVKAHKANRDNADE